MSRKLGLPSPRQPVLASAQGVIGKANKWRGVAHKVRSSSRQREGPVVCKGRGRWCAKGGAGGVQREGPVVCKGRDQWCAKGGGGGVQREGPVVCKGRGQ